MSKEYPTIRIPAELADRIRAAIARKWSHSLTVDEFVRHWSEQALLLFTTKYGDLPSVDLPQINKGLPRIVGRQNGLLRSLGIEVRARAAPSKRRPATCNLPKALVQDIEDAIDHHQVMAANRTQFVLAAAEYGLRVVHQPRDRGMALPLPSRSHLADRRLSKEKVE